MKGLLFIRNIGLFYRGFNADGDGLVCESVLAFHPAVSFDVLIFKAVWDFMELSMNGKSESGSL